MGGPWTEEEERDYGDFLARLGAPIEDAELAAFLAPDADGEFFNLKPELPGVAGCCAGRDVLQ